MLVRHIERHDHVHPERGLTILNRILNIGGSFSNWLRFAKSPRGRCKLKPQDPWDSKLESWRPLLELVGKLAGNSGVMLARLETNLGYEQAGVKVRVF